MINKLIFAAVMLCGVAAQAQPISYPGSTWGSVIFPSGLSESEDDNLLLSGRIEQGVVWSQFGQENRWRLNTFGAVSYSIDNAGLGYNNKLTPAVGVKVQRISNHGIIEIGVQLAQERRFRDNVTTTGAQGFVTWWSGWDLK